MVANLRLPEKTGMTSSAFTPRRTVYSALKISENMSEFSSEFRTADLGRTAYARQQKKQADDGSFRLFLWYNDFSGDYFLTNA